MIHSATHLSGLTRPCLVLVRTQVCTFRWHLRPCLPISLFPFLLLSLPPSVCPSLTHSVLFFFPSPSLPSIHPSFLHFFLFFLYFSPLFLSLFPPNSHYPYKLLRWKFTIFSVEVVFHYGKEAVLAEVWDSWPQGIHSQEVKTDQCWCSAWLLCFIHS